MAYFTSEYCAKKIELWVLASDKIASGQSYTIDNRSLTRADLKYVKEMIDFWEKKYDKVLSEEQSGQKNGGFIGLIPRG